MHLAAVNHAELQIPMTRRSQNGFPFCYHWKPLCPFPVPHVDLAQEGFEDSV